jgi:NAD(P)-dependent dehydrogenase (short-subunit alcohol dehydrogenase family)
MAGRPKQSPDAGRSPTRPVAGRKPLTGLVAVVAGATRGAGRGIARALGEAGATVYCTGRSVRGNRSPYNRPESVDETAEMISSAGGSAIALRVDHTVEREVEEVFGRVVRISRYCIIAEITRSGEYDLRPGMRHLGIVIPFIG